MGHPSVYPTGTTIYNPEKAWGGYTVFQALERGAVLVDMNGTELRLWEGLHGFPNKILPGGYILGHSGERDSRYGMQDMVDLIQVDWDGNVVWKFNGYEHITDPDLPPEWMARVHHDYQRSGNPVGYYAPGQEPQSIGGNTLLLAHTNLHNERISDKLLLDDTIIEVDWEGNILWEWRCSDHFDELGFDDDAKTALYNNPNLRKSGGGMGDWMHINSMSALGPNPWFDQGDTRFHPDNIIWDARESNIIAIIDKQSGNIVWQLGPNYNTPELKHIGWIIGQHHAHMIPAGLPGAGNILVFDNGGWAGYGAPNPASADGVKNAWRDYSRVLEINPVTLDIVWRYSPYEAGIPHPTDAFRFYSPYISNIQRLPNGNTLINEGANGRLFEVTADHEIVWEFISPYWGKTVNTNMLYRAYRVPYEWVPQLPRPQEEPVVAPDNTQLRQPGAAAPGFASVIRIDGTRPYKKSGDALCVATDSEDLKRSPKLFAVNPERFTPLTADSWSELAAQRGPQLLLVGAERCVHCKSLYRQLEAILDNEEYRQLPSHYLDADHHIALAEKLAVRTLPTLIWIENGEEQARLSGAQQPERLRQWLTTQQS
ncbi:aryl-sulfate sulfotransferase [Pectobacterium versatile]|uniref:aryl-sulfate sulfotransferase n=1 Tax=Pectobacterium versatile TaxID=2488639 RepID=UPI00102E2F6F|nr:aryl-sulfate sulfotransferase [Pectobacterium versatile]MBA0183413.1 aryl-sulfate sulfotransferase [Pectobacterium versatile]TAI96292.1 thioredoxin [Pectobacterium versatile]UEQ09020.1 aryl-sulfate sulfotransferase [Pectobacterium versatile]